MGSGDIRHLLKRSLIGVLTLLSLWIGFNLSAAQGQAREATVTEQGQAESVPTGEIKLKDQPFYGELEDWRQTWESGFLGQVVDTNPRLSLIKFYSAMARAGQLMVSVEQQAQNEPGWGWSEDTQQKIEEAERLFRSATQTIDASELPESIRINTKEEAALKLKEILDYVLDHSDEPIEIPTNTENGFWRLPDSMIAMASKLEENADIPYYQFTQRTLNNIDETYNYILEMRENSEPNTSNSFLTPHIYSTYIYTPGYLVPPKFYLKFRQKYFRGVWMHPGRSPVQVLLKRPEPYCWACQAVIATDRSQSPQSLHRGSGIRVEAHSGSACAQDPMCCAES